ncbi:LuxR C-terminal-related transcriptional regulator [Lutimonas sp.]|uniref:LuxR C-terminal-related transcriptional regulator n=1 Tax=Lutimonas sp. TaxID=1872403 RepID=UPI003D9ACC4F
MKTKTIDEFIEGIAAHYPERTKVDGKIQDLQNIKFNINECVFVWELRNGEMLFKKGFDHLLGYVDEDMNLQNFVALFHPDDREYIVRIGQAAVHHSISNPIRNEELCLYVSHRIKKVDGSYVKILAQSSPYEIDSEGLIASFLVTLSDIGFVDTSDAVQYKFLANGLDANVFHDIVFESHNSMFTPREMEVILEIEKGLSNSQIADSLMISKFTVETHRKKIFRKSKCHSAEELLLFCKANGILK